MREKSPPYQKKKKGLVITKRKQRTNVSRSEKEVSGEKRSETFSHGFFLTSSYILFNKFSARFIPRKIK